MLPAAWKPVPANDMIRLGADGDGGYVVSHQAVMASTLLLSFGLCDDWQFEQAFQRRSGARVVAFDHTVTNRFWAIYAVKQLLRLRIRRALKYFSYRSFFSTPKTAHRQVKIGYDGRQQTSVATLMREFADEKIFLKCDIEGWEYRILDDVVENADKFTAMVFEFHDIDINRDRVERFLLALPNFRLIDVHANNYGGVDQNGDPVVIEMSIVREELFSPTTEVDDAKAMHFPNNSRQADMVLAFESVD